MLPEIIASEKLRADALQRLIRGTLAGLAVFATLGTVTAVWINPFFVRMTPVGPWELGATTLTAILAGVIIGLWVPQCRLRTSGAGGVASFLGIACPTCNKVLMLIFGGPALHYFALALTIGICFGIYSSVLVASPLVMWLGVSRTQFVQPKVEKQEAVV